MDQFELIRTASRVYGKSIRQIGRETGHHRVTIRKALAGKQAQYRRQEKPRAPVMDPVAKIVEQWGVGDRQRPRQQRHTARRVYTRLLEEHEFTGAEVTVRRWVREWKAAHGWGRQEAVVPLDYEVLLQALRHRQGEGTGTREFVQVLQLHQEYPASEVQEAVRSVLEKGCPGYESIRQLLRAQETTPLPTGPLPAELIPGGTDRPVPCSDLSPFNAFLPAGALGVGSATPSCWRTRSSACVYRRCCEITRNVRARPEKRVKAMKAFFWIW